MLIWFLFGAMCFLTVLFIFAYVKLTTLDQHIRKVWQQLDAQLKYRLELVPTLALIAASLPEVDRNLAYGLPALKENCKNATRRALRMKYEYEITAAFKQILNIARNHPELDDDPSFLKLQESAVSTERKIKQSIRRYNGMARAFNSLSGVIPLNIIVPMFELKQYDYISFEPTVSSQK